MAQKITISELKRLVNQVINESSDEIYELYESDGEESNLEAQFNEFYNLYFEFKEAKKRLESIQTKYKAVEDVVRQFLEESDDSEKKILKIRDLTVKIKKKGHERIDYKHAMIAAELYNKVNEQMQRMIDEMMFANQTVTYIKSTLEVKSDSENISEMNMFSRVKEKAKEMLLKLKSKIGSLFQINQKLDNLIYQLEDLAY